MTGRLKLGLFDPSKTEGGCDMHTDWPGTRHARPHLRQCEQETRALRAIARTGKPAGYSWRWWWDPRPRVRREVPTGSMHMPRWAYPTPAYRIEVPYNERQEACRLNRIDAWLAGRNPWTYESGDRSTRRRRRVP